jgi:hypothetical protein
MAQAAQVKDDVLLLFLADQAAENVLIFLAIGRLGPLVFCTSTLFCWRSDST